MGTGTGIGIGIPFRRMGGGFDSDYKAVLDYATSLGYTLPSAPQQILQNQLMIDLKSAGVWNKLDSFRVYATDGSAAYALIDWKRLVLCTAVNSPTFTTNLGYKGNGTSSYINSNFTPSIDGVNYTLNSASMFVYIGSLRTTGQIQAYQGNIGSNQSLIAAGSPPFGESYINGNSGPVFNATTGIGFQLVNRFNPTTINVYFNGILQNTNSSSSPTALSNISLWDFGGNDGASGILFSDVGNAIIGYGANLNAEQSAFNTAVNNYMNAI
jgi:hypothetical protein